jgi:hypothetical protein
MRKLTIPLTLILFLMATFPPTVVHADVAPPEAPAGTSLFPGNETTQVRMVAETVTLAISTDPNDPKKAIARTEAIFTMRNLGNAEEKMPARFPLSFFNGNSNGFGVFPEIPSIEVWVNGSAVSTRRENQPAVVHKEGDHPMPIPEREEVPWAVFDVSFPPDQDVIIEVAYTVNGYGYYPYDSFKYILETGAGWKDTIGSADIIVQMPYEVNGKNIDLTGPSGYGQTTPGAVFDGNEIRWHFAELEPTWQDNIQVMVVSPSLWESVLKETDNVSRNPNDGEAWGRLGKAYKEIVNGPRFGREDPDGLEMFKLSKNAYEKCLALLPNDSLWHYGYADLLWTKYYWNIYWFGIADTEGILPRILSELEIALKLDPNNQQAKDLLSQINLEIPEAVSIDGENYVFLGLTATPNPPAPYPDPTEIAVSTPTQIPTTEITPTSEAPSSSSQNPLCGSAFLVPGLLGLVFVLNKRKQK